MLDDDFHLFQEQIVAVFSTYGNIFDVAAKMLIHNLSNTLGSFGVSGIVGSSVVRFAIVHKTWRLGRLELAALGLEASSFMADRAPVFSGR